MRRGEGIIAIVSEDHRDAILSRMNEDGYETSRALREGRFAICDAAATMARFMTEGEPDADRFETVAGGLVRGVRARTSGARVRAYGEMVDLLWNAGRPRAASAVERLWNDLLAKNDFSLFCAYQVDLFGAEFQAGVVDPVMCAHSHVVPFGSAEDLRKAIERAVVEVLGPEAGGMERVPSGRYRPSWAVIPRAEAAVLRLRNHFPAHAEEILAGGRKYYQGSR